MGLLGASRAVRLHLRSLTDADARRMRRDFRTFRTQHGPIFTRPPSRAPVRARTALIIGPRWPAVEVQLTLIKAIEQAGFEPVMLLLVPDLLGLLGRYYRTAGVRQIVPHELDTFGAERLGHAAAAVIGRVRSLNDLLAHTHAGVRAGRIAASTAIRKARVGFLDPQDGTAVRTLTTNLARSLAAIERGEQVLDAIRPDLVVLGGPEYSPTAELFDLCLIAGIDVVVYDVAHRSSRLMFKRYHGGNRDDHWASLSDDSWERLRSGPWTRRMQEDLKREFAEGYGTGDWYGASLTQAHTRRADPAEIRGRWKLDPGRKTAVIYSHILWDAPLAWGAPIFPSYEHWLVETVRAACANDRVNWVVKVHPAHVGKRPKDAAPHEPAELTVLRRAIGDLPPHVRLVLPESDVSTESVFAVSDYCVTVRGTVGIEAASRGIPVMTAARSRYSHRGFTVDSDTVEDYLSRLASIQDQTPLGAAERELAERFAYGLFVARPFVSESVTWTYGRQVGEQTRASIHLRTRDDWAAASDLAALSDWLGRTADEDYLAAGAVV